jgi:hypothetical protein
MCDFSGKLVACLDHELPDDEMAMVQSHVRDCIECRSQLDAAQQLSGTFDAYCDAVLASRVCRRLPRWVPVASAAVAAAVAAALFLLLPGARVEPLASPPAVKPDTSPIVVEIAPPALKLVHRRHPIQRVQRQNANWLPAEPAIQIAIPVESIFPPGAVPEGVTFIADLSIAADGSAQQIRLHPRLVEIQRRVTEP